MIKLKNLWKIALATMTMSAMLVACDTESSDNGKKNDDSGLGLTGVYSYTVNRDDIAIAWGGSGDSPIFSVMFLDETTLEIVKEKGDLKKNPFSHPEYQIGAFGNMYVTEEIEEGDEGNFAVYGANPVDGVYKYYDGVAVTITETELKVFVDTAKLVKTQLKATFEKGADGKDEAVMTDKHSVDLKGYKPYVIALASKANDPDSYVASGFSADLMKMEEGATFPAGDLKKDAPPVPKLSEMKLVCTNLGDAEDITFSGDVATFEFTFNSAKLADWREPKGLLQFGVCSDGNWTKKYTGAEITALDTAVVLKYMASDNNKVAANVLEDGKTYVLTINAKDNTVKISAK